MANIQELSPKITEALHLEKVFLEKEIQSIHQFLNKEVDRRSDRKSPSDEVLNLKEQDKIRLCSHCLKKNEGLCRVCSHKFNQRKPQRSSSAKLKADSKMIVPSIDVDREVNSNDVAQNVAKSRLEEESHFKSIPRPSSNDTQQSKVRLRIQDARDEHFFSDDL